jgi:hypothetical protein
MPERPFTVFSRREIQEEADEILDGSQGSFMSVNIRIAALKVSVSATLYFSLPPSPSFLLWPGLVKTISSNHEYTWRSESTSGGQ